MKSKKTLRIIGISIAALLLLLIIGKAKGWFGRTIEIKVSTEFVEKRTLIETVSASGKIQPVTEIKITPDISGEVVALYIKEGDKVTRGQMLAKINPDIYMSNLDRMEATLNSAKANLANTKARLAQIEAQFLIAKNAFERSEKLWHQKLIADAEYEQSKGNFEVSKADVEAAKQSVIAGEFNIKSAEASLKEAKDNLQKTTIYSPADGTISKLAVEKGERVVGTSQFAGTEIMRIANLNEMEVIVSVNENDIVRVKLNDTALIEVDAYLNQKFKGIVTQIANSASTTGLSTDQVTNFDVKIRILPDSYKNLIDINNPHISPFRPGMSATVDIQTKTAFNVLTVPIQAVTTRSDTSSKKLAKNKRPQPMPKPEENQPKSDSLNEYVFLFDNGKAKLQKVKTGIQNNTYIEILEGLQLKQEIIAAPYYAISKKLNNGDVVKKVNKEQLYNQEK